MAPQLLAKRSRRQRRVQNSQVAAGRAELGENLDHRSVRRSAASASRRPAGVLHHELLQIGGGDPNARLGLADGGNDGFVVAPAGNEIERDGPSGTNEIHRGTLAVSSQSPQF